MYLVDTNVLLDLVTDDSNWSEWSPARLTRSHQGVGSLPGCCSISI
jgi:predicted nucleic acid-binding protein